MRKLFTLNNVPLSLAGSLPYGHPLREQVVDNLAAAIHHGLFVANVMTWRNVRTGTQHWREDCPSLRRSKHARAELIPQRPGMTKPCGQCALVEKGEQLTKEFRVAQRRLRALLALEGPESPYIDPTHVWTPPVALLPRGPRALEAA